VIILSYPKLTELTDKSTFQELVTTLKEKYPREKMANFFMQLRSFRMTQSFLSEIYDRIVKDIKTERKYWSIRAEFEYFQNEEYDLSDEEKQLLKEYPKIKTRLYLDIEDWFLHAHILMEKFSKLSKSFTLKEANSIVVANVGM